MTSMPISESWISYSKPSARARLRLFCFPYAGGGASIYRSWSSDLPQEIEVCPVQLPGREHRITERPFTQFNLLIQTLAQALHPYLRTPFAFFGHSMGALISFELARLLRRQNDPTPVHLFVSAHRASQIAAADLPIHHLPELAFMEKLRRLNGTAQEVLENAELMQLLLPVLRADFAVCETYIYRPEEPLACPLSVFGGWQDSGVSYSDLQAWREQTRGSFSLRMYEGNHFFLYNSRIALLRAVCRDLTQHMT